MKKILVAADFSENALQALKYAVLLAQATSAEIILLNVYDIYFPADGAPIMPYAHELMADESLHKLKKLAAENIPQNIKFSLKSVLGSAVNEITKAAEENNAGLIVMGIRGSSRLSQIIIGSTTTSVLHNSNIPVFVIPENTILQLPKKILFAYDGKEIPSKATMKPLIEIAKNIHSKILTLNIITETEAEHVDKKYIAREAFYALKSTNYSMHFTEDGDVLNGISTFIDQHKTHAVTMIYHRMGFFSRLFNESRAHKMAFYTKKPLLVLPEIEE